MEEEILENLEELIEEWEREIEQLNCMIQNCPELEENVVGRKETLEEVINKLNFLRSEFTIVE